MVRLIVMFDVEVILGFEIENVEFPAKSPAGVTLRVAFVDPGSIAEGIVMFIVTDLPLGRPLMETTGQTSKLIWLLWTVPWPPNLYCPFTSSFAIVLGVEVPIPILALLSPKTIALY